MNYKEIQSLKKSELRDLLATTLQQKATLERANWSILTDVKELKDDNTKLIELTEEIQEESNIFRTQNIALHKRLDGLKEQINELVQPLAEGSTLKNAYLSDCHTIFSDSGEIHLISDHLSLVINIIDFARDLPTIKRMVIEELEEQLTDLRNT